MFRVRVRMGIHSGPCGTAVSVKYIWKPYFFIYGQAVEIAKLMGATSEPMKIQVSAKRSPVFDCSSCLIFQVSKVTIDILDHSGGPFNYIPRDPLDRPPGSKEQRKSSSNLFFNSICKKGVGWIRFLSYPVFANRARGHGDVLADREVDIGGGCGQRGRCRPRRHHRRHLHLRAGRGPLRRPRGGRPPGPRHRRGPGP